MRKGRSSRRSRVSRPSIGPKTMQNVEASGAEPAAPHVPNVVIGVSVPPPATSEPPPRIETDAATSLAPTSQAREQRLKAEAAAHAEKAIEQLDSAPPPAEEKIEAETEAKVEAKVEAKTDAKVEETTKAEETKAEETKAEASVAARDELTPPPPATTIDEESIPPVGDLAVHEKFFSQGDLGAIAADDDELELDAPDKAKRKSAPEVVQRRARFVRYVTWAVGVSAVVCLAAVVRTAMAPSSKTIAAPAQAAMIVEPPAAKAAPPAPLEVQPAAPVAAAEPTTTTTTTTAAAPEAPASPEPEAAKPAPSAAGDEVKGDAKEEKASCKKALEHGKIADAIEAGERAVALDETDAEAWLLLGAAYQEKGKLADARRAYTSCVKLGSKSKHTTECAQMLR